MTCLVVLAVLFAPTTGEGPEGSSVYTRAPVETRTLAPTVREAIVALGPDFRLGQSAEQRPLPVTGLPIAASVAAAVLLSLFSFAWGASVGNGPRLTPLRSLVPRGPPKLPAV